MTQQEKPKLKAPELETIAWLNSSAAITLESLLGKVVLLHAFQMLCPACVHHAIPQTQRIYEESDANHLAVIGLHTVFEHHDVMGQKALEAFVHENRLLFPIGIDKPSEDMAIPATMAAYYMQGTPTTILIDKAGYIRMHRFGQISDYLLGLSIGTLLAE